MKILLEIETEQKHENIIKSRKGLHGQNIEVIKNMKILLQIKDRYGVI